MTTLVLADHDHSRLSEQTARAVTAALALGEDVHVLVAGQGARPAAEEAAALVGVGCVRLADDPAYAHHLPEPLAALIVSLAGDFGAIVSSASAVGKSALPRVAALLDVAQVSEIIEIVAPDTFKRPIYAGNAIQTVQTTDAKKVLTVRTSAFSPAPTGGGAPIEPVTTVSGPELSYFVEDVLSASERPSLTSARVVISGGRAFGSAEKFRQYLTPVADRLGAAIGASRAAVDAGYAPNDWQVGQTGKIVAPDLYIACGISGAIQHLAGMKDSRVIVAINNDPEAPIFQIADYGLVADVFEALSELERALR